MNLDWDNLKNDSCPACGFFLEETEKGYECKQHKQSFFIPKEKFIKIKRDLQEKDDFAFPRFN